MGSRKARNDVVSAVRAGSYSVLAGQVSSQRQLVRPWNWRRRRRETTVAPTRLRVRLLGKELVDRRSQ